MSSARTLRTLPICVAILLLLALARNPIAETIEGAVFSTAIAVLGGLAIGAALILAVGARRSHC